MHKINLIVKSIIYFKFGNREIKIINERKYNEEVYIVVLIDLALGIVVGIVLHILIKFLKEYLKFVKFVKNEKFWL